MFFRILLISFISWGIFKLYRILTGRRRPGPAPFQQERARHGYDGRAVDAQFEEVDDAPNSRSDG